MVCVRPADVADLLAMQRCNLLCLPENYQLKVWGGWVGAMGGWRPRPCRPARPAAANRGRRALAAAHPTPAPTHFLSIIITTPSPGRNCCT